MISSKLDAEIREYFPYPQTKPFQDDFMSTIFEAVQGGHSVIIEGSNGLGKTVAALSACLPVAIEKGLRILYVARTHRQHDRVIEELKAISKNQSVAGISIRGRHELCLNRTVSRFATDARSFMEICELMKAKNRCVYYRNIKEKQTEYRLLQELITSEPFTASEIQKICSRKGYCPYELAKSVLADMNVVALSYLYVFDPEIYGIFLRHIETRSNKIILIVDEAHNLPETAISIASSMLTLYGVKQAEFEARKFKNKEIVRFAGVVRKIIEESVQRIAKETLVSPEYLTDVIKKQGTCDGPSSFIRYLRKSGETVKRSLMAEGKNPRSFIYGLSEFISAWIETIDNESYIRVLSRYTSKRGIPTAKLQLVALDPSIITEPIFSSVYSSVVTSGTLQPLDAFTKTTHMPNDTVQSSVPSPFPREHILPLICCGVTTALEQRTPNMYNKIIERLVEVVENTPANIGIFAASFDVLNSIASLNLEGKIKKPLFCEHRNMSSRENEKLVSDFKSRAGDGGAVLLGVQGGRSSEGVDFPGDEMNSVVIVGVPYAEPTPKVKSQIEFFERSFPNHGREYGYVIPAMKKASQAAGRPIRTVEDKGAMMFFDQRFAAVYNQSFFPVWIRENLQSLPDQKGVIAEKLSDFFR